MKLLEAAGKEPETWADHHGRDSECPGSVGRAESEGWSVRRAATMSGQSPASLSSRAARHPQPAAPDGPTNVFNDKVDITGLQPGFEGEFPLEAAEIDQLEFQLVRVGSSPVFPAATCSRTRVRIGSYSETPGVE